MNINDIIMTLLNIPYGNRGTSINYLVEIIHKLDY